MEEKPEPQVGEKVESVEEEKRVVAFFHQLETEGYAAQLERWPKFGRFIRAQWTDEAILVYQAFKPEIGQFAVEHQRFVGCPAYSSTRMSWIKTNFLWMMFRNGWGEKVNQEVTLGIWLKRTAFERYISFAVNKEQTERKGSVVRVQWDPDHDPSGEPLKNKRVIQMGLKNIPTFANGEDILRIDDLTDFVANCARNDPSKLIMPKETIYEPLNKRLITDLGLSRELKEEGEKPSPEEEPLRISICYKGRRKVVLLHPRTMLQLSALVHQKFRARITEVTDSKGKTVLDQQLKTLPQDSVLTIL